MECGYTACDANGRVGVPQRAPVRFPCSSRPSRPPLSWMPRALARDNGDIFSRSFPVGSAAGRQRNPDMKSPLVFAREQEKSRCSIVFALLRLIFSLQFSLLIANFSSFSKSHSTSALFLPPFQESWCFEKLPQMGQGETHMLVFNLLEILFSWCYWDGRLPGSPGRAAGDSALRTNSLQRRDELLQVQSLPGGPSPGQDLSVLGFGPWAAAPPEPPGLCPELLPCARVQPLSLSGREQGFPIFRWGDSLREPKSLEQWYRRNSL